MQDNGGWLSVKRKGRDDGAIAAASKRAAEERRARRGLGPLQKKATGKRAGGKKKKASKQAIIDSDDDDDDESEEFSVAKEESSAEELSDVEQDDGADDEDNDDEDVSSFLPKYGKRPRVKSMMVESQKMKERNKRNGTNAGNTHNVSLSSSEDGDDDEALSDFSPPKKATAAATKKSKTAAKKASMSSKYDIPSSDEDDAHFGGGTSKYFKGRSKSNIEGVSSTAATKKSPDPWSTEDDTPVQSKRSSNQQRKQKRSVLEVNYDDDFTPPKKPAASNRASISSPGELFVDSDEEVALAAAIKASLKDQRKGNGQKSKPNNRLKKLGAKKKKAHENNQKNKRRKKAQNESPSGSVDSFLKDSDDEEYPVNIEEEDEEDEIVEIADSSSSEDEGADDDQDNYMDDEAKEASSILKTANELSASVLRIMTSWVGDSANGGDDNDPAVPPGMIVDGAIAMTSLKQSSGASSGSNANKANKKQQNHTWISDDVMKEILPSVKLAEYQLLGINWLAMLHNMTCTLKSSTADGKKKKPTKTNVNGVLADEMGLGKTCQTIAFLAWLKHSRQQGNLREEAEPAIYSGAHGDDNDDNDGDGPASDDDDSVIDVDAKVSMRDSDEQSSPNTRLPHLIVVPASVVSNWQREFETFAPNLHVVKYHGTMEERTQLQEDLRRYLPKYRKKGEEMVDVILSSITYFQKDSSDDRDFLRKFKFDYMVIDEGHMLKNAKGLRYRNLDRFKTRHRLLLTGTPVQNSPKELMALLCFLMPLFSRKNNDFGDQNENDGGEAMLQHFVQLEENATKSDHSSEASAYTKLKQLFAPFVLRRRKQDVLSQILPPKIYQVERVTLDDRARTIYNGIVSDHLKAKRNKTASATDHLFTSLRKAANHPLLLRTRYKSPGEVSHLVETFHKYGAFRGEANTKERVASELEKYSDFEIHLTALDLLQENPLRSKDVERYVLTEDDLFCSAKFVKLRSLLPELIGKGHRILIFSVWTTLLDLLSCLLESMDLSYRRMDGQTPVAERQSRIDEFNQDDSIKVFLLSTKACGLGINLTSADTCIMHDLDFNPFADLQAEDRCHRIGQKKPVTIIKMVANDTVDSSIYDMQERKAKMESAIMSTTDWSKQERKEKANIMKNVVDCFLKSPQGKSKNPERVNAEEKENLINLADSEAEETNI